MHLNSILGLIVGAVVIAPCVASMSDEAARGLLAEGDALLLKGRSAYDLAAQKYSKVVESRPEDVTALLRRSEVYKLQRDFGRCRADLERVLQLDSSNAKALEMQAKLKLVQGDIEGAARDIQKAVKSRGPGSGAKVKALEKTAKEYQQLANAWRNLQLKLDAVASAPSKSRDEVRRVNQECVRILKELIFFAKESVDLRFKRVECAIAAHQQADVSDDLKYLAMMEPNSLRVSVANAKSLRLLGAADHAKREVRRCLSLDPEYAPCAKLHKLMKAFDRVAFEVEKYKSSNSWENVVKTAQSALDKFDDDVIVEQLLKWICEAHANDGNTAQGIAACTKLIDFAEMNSETAVFLLHRAELNIQDEDFDAAAKDVEVAESHLGANEKVQSLKNRIEAARRGAGRKDYYKLLGVKKTAEEKDIRRAYRKLARLYHPDHYAPDATDKEKAKNDQRFRDLNEAKEILLDPEKRRRYDAGEDVANPDPNQGGGFHGFYGGGGFHNFQQFHFGQGGSFQFHFG